MSLPTNFFIGRGAGLYQGPAIDLTGASSGISSYTMPSSGRKFYYTTSVSGYLTVFPNGTLYVGMIGAGGGGGRDYNGGDGGIGIASFIIPLVDTAGNSISRIFFSRGNKGVNSNNASAIAGGSPNGGQSGSAGGNYSVTGGSGGGLCGIQAGSSSAYLNNQQSHTYNSNVHLAYAGSGGGGAIQEGGNGGGFNENGKQGSYGVWGSGGGGGTLTAGGAAYSPQPSYTSQNATDGGPLYGGRGGDSQYDGGSGGGAGWYGGGGGVGGGGYDGSPGGGGSGYCNLTYGTVLSARTGNSGSTLSGQTLLNDIATQTGDNTNELANFFDTTAGRGGGAGRNDGYNSFIVFWDQ